MTPNESELKALLSLKNNNDFKIIMEMFRREWFDSAVAATNNWGEAAIKIAGHAQVFQMFIDIVDTVEDRLKDQKNQENLPRGVVI